MVRHISKGWRYLVWFAGWSFAVAAYSAESYTFGVVPQFEQRKLFSIWKPIVEEIAKRTGIELNLVATLTVPDFERQLAAGNYDFIYANPYHILREFPRQGYIPLIRDKAPLRGILVVRKDAPFQSPADLDGKSLAIPSFNALGASLLMRADLEQILRVHMTPLNAKSHSSVYLHVINGLAAAGGGVEKTLQEQNQSIRDALRVLYTTREMPSHPIAAHPRISANTRQRIQHAFLDLASTENGRHLLAAIPIKEAIQTSIKDYQPMNQWGLEKYWVDQ